MKIHRKREAPAKGSNHKFKKAIGLTKLPPVRMLLSFFVPFVFFVVNPYFLSPEGAQHQAASGFEAQSHLWLMVLRVKKREKFNHKEHKRHKEEELVLVVSLVTSRSARSRAGRRP